MQRIESEEVVENYSTSMKARLMPSLKAYLEKSRRIEIAQSSHWNSSPKWTKTYRATVAKGLKYLISTADNPGSQNLQFEQCVTVWIGG